MCFVLCFVPIPFLGPPKKIFLEFLPIYCADSIRLHLLASNEKVGKKLRVKKYFLDENIEHVRILPSMSHKVSRQFQRLFYVHTKPKVHLRLDFLE